MKTGFANLHHDAVRVLAVIGLFCVFHSARGDEDGQKAVEETRQSLRHEGFKTDLPDFDLSTPPDIRDREAILFSTDRNHLPNQIVTHPNLMEPAGSNATVVVWKLGSVQWELDPSAGGEEVPWADFRASLVTNQARFDTACAAILAGPIRFNLVAGHGHDLLLPHLTMLKNLELTLGSRAVLALHDGDLPSAWTNILAASRLVTEWDVEPVEVSHLVQADLASHAFNVIWQALQTNAWSDSQLGALQAEWESANFMAKIPETAAYRRACDVALCAKERQDTLASRPAFSEFFNHAGDQAESPGPAELEARWKQIEYAEHGSFEDQKALLLFYRTRELELRDAIHDATWSAMRRRDVVTNAARFKSESRSILQARIQQRDMSMAIQSGGAGLLGSAAETEAKRRVIVTALALERWRARHGNYPEQLAELTPEFLAKPLPDFIDGQPLRYRRAGDGHFILYSIGLDEIDDGGAIERTERPNFAELRRGRPSITDKGDFVWPLPASVSMVEATREDQRKARVLQAEQAEDMQAESQWTHTARHQVDAEKLPAGPAAKNVADPKFHGRPLSEVIRNPAAGTNQLTLGEMLNLRPIKTGDEPEVVAFELPISYDVLNNLGRLFLYIDVNNDRSEEGCNVQQMDCKRAENGNCRLVWNTIYESPGKHMLQAGVMINELASDNTEIAGPYLPFTITNFCQFSDASAMFDPKAGATFHAKLPEKNARFSIDMLTTNGVVMKTISGSTTNGIMKLRWDLIDSKGIHFAGDEFNSVIHVTLPDSGRSQTMRGP